MFGPYPQTLISSSFRHYPIAEALLAQVLGPTVSVAIVSAVMEKTYRRNTYQYKLKDSKTDELRKLGEFLVEDYRVAFKKAYGNLLGVLSTKEDEGLIFIFAQFYDPTLHCFTFHDFLLAPTLEEFAHLLQLPGLPSKFQFENATVFANSGSWDAFYASFALLIYGPVLFPSVEGFTDKTVITIFISQNLVPTLLANVFFSFHWRNMKKGGTINCCIPLLHKWIMSHLPKKGSFVDNVGALKWSQRLMSLDAEDVVWYSHDYLRVELIFRCEEFPNVSLVITKGGLINYNHVLSLRQLGYPLKQKLENRILEELLLAEGVENMDLMKKVRRAWGKIQRIGKKELGK
ncbi:uncharacterized protein LOC127094519 [Lathyrus oleraceus]|uniref:uncharacterized protein LOC127094519 n=1 Tax=Pisum sativum TaxID=3888 RepID=UPI0021D3DF1C|nr:uncharacterized protein LOC127094519 [Pisum sativum]